MSNQRRARTYEELLPSERRAYLRVVELLGDPGNFDYVPLSEEARAVVAEEAGEEAANTSCMVPKYTLPGDERPGRLDGVRLHPQGYVSCGWIMFHRVSYELNVGDIPAGYVVDHLCHQRYCCEPTHLRACTAEENSKGDRRRGELWVHPYESLIPELTKEQKEALAEHRRNQKENRREYDRKYREGHREERAEYARKWNAKHREATREHKRKYREEHREELREHDRKYREGHREERAEYARKYYQDHKEEINARQRERRARKKAEAAAAE